MEAIPKWFKRKNYSHFDLPMSYRQADQYVSNPRNIESHQFLPFLAFDLEHRRLRSGENGKVEVREPKKRPIRMASHRDGYVYAYYASLLSEAYEKKFQGEDWLNSILAYRKGIGSNIKFANDAFNEIAKRKNCAAIAIDISSFFDSLDHSILKSKWCEVLGEEILPKDHYKVYRAITKYSLVYRDVCLRHLEIPEIDQMPRPLCSIRDFRDKIRAGGLIKTHQDTYGIPQGSAISAVLSNVYMSDFDRTVYREIQALGGSYRRYCDDILVIVDISLVIDAQNIIYKAIKETGSQLVIQSEKTQTSLYGRDGKLTSDSNSLQYLGFEFDGERKLIRSQTMSRYWRKAKSKIHSAKRRANKNRANSKVYKRNIYRLYTHLGRKNFFTYVRRAEKIMQDKHVKGQMKGSWKKIKNMLDAD